jgi:hypothetical protein
MQAMLEPFVRELAGAHEELGREKERRERAEERIAALEAELEALRETRESPQSEAGPGPDTLTPAPEEAQEGTQRPQAPRSLWARIFSGSSGANLYSPNDAVEEFCELRLQGFLGSAPGNRG